MYLVNVKCQYLKITFEGILDFSSIGNNGTVDAEDLTKITGIGLNISSADSTLIFFNAIPLEATPQQVVIFVNWNGPSDALVSAGASTVDSGDWADFSRDAQNVVAGSGKVIIPIRSKDKFNIIKEKLKQISPFAFELPHGSVHRNVQIELMDDNDEIIDSKTYDVDIDSGIIRFQSSMHERIIYSAINENRLIKVGIKASFGRKPESITINSIGYMLTINQDQSAILINQAPIAIQVKISPPIVYPYTNVLATYRYVDQEGDIEDLANRIVKWYRNGIEIPQLRGIMSYNDLHDPEDHTYSFFYTSNYARIEAQGVGSIAEILANFKGERFFEPGDELYFTIQVHDGSQHSGIVRSPSITVSDYPAIPGSLTIRSRFAPPSETVIGGDGGDGGFGGGGATVGELASEFTNRTTLFLDFDLFSPAAFNKAVAKWYVTDNAGTVTLFKAGSISDSSLSMSTMSPSERNPTTLFEAVKIGHQIHAELFIPKDALPVITADVVIRSNTVEIVNIIPRILYVRKEGANETGTGTRYWWFTYIMVDEDIVQQEPNQSNQSVIRLFKKRVVDSFFSVDNTSVENPLSQFPVDDIFESDDTIYLEVTPYDGVAFGSPVKSEEYIIGPQP